MPTRVSSFAASLETTCGFSCSCRSNSPRRIDSQRQRIASPVIVASARCCGGRASSCSTRAKRSMPASRRRTGRASSLRLPGIDASERAQNAGRGDAALFQRRIRTGHACDFARHEQVADARLEPLVVIDEPAAFMLAPAHARAGLSRQLRRSEKAMTDADAVAIDHAACARCRSCRPHSASRSSHVRPSASPSTRRMLAPKITGTRGATQAAQDLRSLQELPTVANQDSRMRERGERTLHPLREDNRGNIRARAQQLIRDDELQRMTAREHEIDCRARTAGSSRIPGSRPPPSHPARSNPETPAAARSSPRRPAPPSRAGNSSPTDPESTADARLRCSRARYGDGRRMPSTDELNRQSMSVRSFDCAQRCP